MLAADAVQHVGNGHPGTAMSLAPVAYLLFQKVMRHNPSNTNWPGRDRFVLSCGHSSLSLYIQLYLGGFGLELDDIKAYRILGIADAGSPGACAHQGRRGHHRAAGPGRCQCRGNGHGRSSGRADCSTRMPHPAPRSSTITSTASPPMATSRRVCRSEASSLAATQRLDNLTLIYDSNRISDRGRHEHRPQRGHHGPVRGVRLARADRRTGPTATLITTRRMSLHLQDALEAAKAVTDRPSFICLHYDHRLAGPHLQGTGKAHGAALGEEEVADTKKVLGFDPEKTFEVADEVIEPHAEAGRTRSRRPSRSGSRPTTAGQRPIRKARHCMIG